MISLGGNPHKYKGRSKTRLKTVDVMTSIRCSKFELDRQECGQTITTLTKTNLDSKNSNEIPRY